jgi:hypothetical protein
MKIRTLVLVRLVRAVVRIKKPYFAKLSAVGAVCIYRYTHRTNLAKAHQEVFFARVLFLGRSHQAQTALVKVTQGRKVSHVYGL